MKRQLWKRAAALFTAGVVLATSVPAGSLTVNAAEKKRG